MKIGILRFSALGDIIVSAVFLPYLKTLYPNCEIDWFVDERFGGILDDSPCIKKLHKIPLKKLLKSFNPFNIYRLYQDLKSHEKYDILIDMQGLVKSSVIGSLLKKDKFVGFDKNSIREKMASIFYDQGICIPYERNILERNASLLYGAFGEQAGLEVCLQDRKSVFGCTQNGKNKIDALDCFEGNKKTILFVLEASKENKTYPVQQYIELAKLMRDENVKILLLWHAYPQKAQQIFNAINTSNDVFLLPQLNLDELKALIKKVDIVIGGDTGVTHLAWAMQRASITLYGNTPMERFKLFGTKNISLSGNICANYHKNDFSISKIQPKTIDKEIRGLL
ncbi:lipopolysaccharide heptosyltransferase I [Helicobacter sp. 11S03491-1]|uniref:lipopolysaccharide heptosyltransferase I n=1 Tax=Helicobacter sp. 11S03491-1 TaxID=1476196 RepID=UPI000BA59B0F|nr:lipopolysaccharide heptosyltransferase I [Helicobacter sp. 11S03491-1]PAF41135.1 lipopolysaccharide heptosyltransferase I [Helicobacter sp. 11S03491-1]